MDLLLAKAYTSYIPGFPPERDCLNEDWTRTLKCRRWSAHRMGTRRMTHLYILWSASRACQAVSAHLLWHQVQSMHRACCSVSSFWFWLSPMREAHRKLEGRAASVCHPWIIHGPSPAPHIDVLRARKLLMPLYTRVPSAHRCRPTGAWPTGAWPPCSMLQPNPRAPAVSKSCESVLGSAMLL